MVTVGIETRNLSIPGVGGKQRKQPAIFPACYTVEKLLTTLKV